MNAFVSMGELAWVIAERQWSAYADRMAAVLGDGWRVLANVQGAEFDAELPGADALLALEIPRGNLPAATGLKLFLFPGAGILRGKPDDYPAGCHVVNVFEHGAAVAEYVMASLLMWVTGLPGYSESFRRGSWTGSGRMGGVPHAEICGKTLGLIGYGTIGRAVAERALAFGMRVLAIAKARRCPAGAFLGGPSDMPRRLEESDFMTLACPYTPETHGLLGAAELARIKPSAYLVNVARAEIVDERALFEALRDGRLGGAALDVWYQYPQNQDTAARNPRRHLSHEPHTDGCAHVQKGIHGPERKLTPDWSFQNLAVLEGATRAREVFCVTS